MQQYSVVSAKRFSTLWHTLDPAVSEQRRRKSVPAALKRDLLTLEQAIFCLEHPLAVRRDFAGREESVWERIDQLVADARRERPLGWQAYEARCDRRERERVATSTMQAAEAIIAWQAAGGSLPHTPPLPAGG